MLLSRILQSVRAASPPRRHQRFTGALLALLAVSVLLAPAQAAADDDDSVMLILDFTTDDVRHREFARGAVETVAEKWKWTRPGVSVEDVNGCKGQDACFSELARSAGASHFAVLGLAPLDDTQLVVSMRVFRTSDGGEIWRLGELAPLDGDVRQTGRTVIGAPLAKLRGMPVVVEKAPVAPKTRSSRGLSPMTIAGFSAMGVGVAGGLAVASIAAFGILDVGTGIPTEVMSAAAATIVVVGVGAGVSVVTLAAFLEE